MPFLLPACCSPAAKKAASPALPGAPRDSLLASASVTSSLGHSGCAGKTTLLQVVAGKFMVDPSTVRVLGRPPFHDLALASSGELSYLGPQWKRDIAFAGTDVPLQGDLGAGQMIFNVTGVDAARRERLIRLLDIDLEWRMNQVSDGQRRRVQICMGLLKPYEVGRATLFPLRQCINQRHQSVKQRA